MTEKERYGTVSAFQRLFVQEGVEVASSTIAARIEEGRKMGIVSIAKTARLKGGKIIHEGFYAESEVRAACRNLFNRLNTEYFSDRVHIFQDLTAYARQLGEDKTPLDLSANNISSISIACQNGKTVKGDTYLNNAAVALGLAAKVREAGFKQAEILQHLLKSAGIEIRDNSYYRTKEFILHDLTSFASQLGQGKTPPNLNTDNISSLSITCHNGEQVKGQTYLKNAAVALGLAKRRRGAKGAEALSLLFKTAGIEIRDSTYYQTRDFVLFDLTACAQKLGDDKTPRDLSTGNALTLSFTCRNGENAKGQTYIRNAAIALGLAKDGREAGSKLAEVLRKLKEIAGFLAPSNDR